MKIIPIAFDSLGVRSMATYVETPDVKILIDPGCALAGNRYGRPPHPIEQKLMMKFWHEIKAYAKKADILIITHYHYDHYNPDDVEIFNGKKLFIKHPEQKINKSQATRARAFLKKVVGLPEVIEYSDGREFKFGHTILKFSQPLPHGADEKLGCVTSVSISDGKHKFVHTSDIEGATLKSQEDFIIHEDPEICIMDGPMTYIYGMHTRALAKIIKGTHKLKTLIVDHHFLRDLKWREKMKDAIQAAKEKGVKLECVAEYLGQKENLLEPIRKKLFEEHPVTSHNKDFNVPWKA
ncbi:MAG: MBL fold metallo-hydrolase [Candidatus Margulisbacteria bacterium]|nr:MBL fold metallo-hydrolase [Candidatus Margulisiibacteriota bacterium]MBU1021044.1 MBL fold metallo-hydrolase [Candidatus Margulisiibacteriota bacterium]MBU1729719.1 MBL fold metallo-hydrolase [Candidatus Margulisiibacteriota bacterium]MBU1955984.1 MBL fold metallo-hydrolase [Candidatus Margulisiibacteriota bacterium]